MALTPTQLPQRPGLTTQPPTSAAFNPVTEGNKNRTTGPRPNPQPNGSAIHLSGGQGLYNAYGQKVLVGQ